MIEYTIKFTENPEAKLKLMELYLETKDAPDATQGEMVVAKAFEAMVAAFKEQMALNGKKPSVALPKNRIIHN